MAETSSEFLEVIRGLAGLTSSVESLKERIVEYRADNASLRLELNTKHAENRKSIHEIRNDLQNISDRQTQQEMKIKQILFYAAIGGMAAGFIKELVEFGFKFIK